MAWRAFVRLPRRSALARCRPAARPGDEGDPLRLLATGAVSFLGVGGWVFSREREPAHAQASIHSVPEALGRPPRPASVFEADSARASGGAGIVKTRCFAKRYADGRAYAQGTCGEGDETKTDFAAAEEQDLARSLAVSKLAERCGLADVSVRQWRERVRTAGQ